MESLRDPRLPIPIEEHGIIGDGRSAALVASDGTVDWLCWPRFDSEPTFAALLDEARSGAWALWPEGGWDRAQRYLADTNVLVTRFERGDACVDVFDFMPVWNPDEARRRLIPEHEIVRIVECRRGEAELASSVRFAPARTGRAVRKSDRGAFGLCAELRSGAFFLRGERPHAWVQEEARATFRIGAGERIRFSLSWSPEGPAVLPPLRAWADDALEATTRFWRNWARAARYDGPWPREVRRSALVLKLLQYPPSGALLAAATTSLPERFGGDLNWDYRYCWLRDAAFTARSLYGLGYRAEADAFVYWLLHTTGLTQPRLAVLYDVFGNSPGRERVAEGLGGYGGARPVRIGNAAEHQLQLDVHGEVIDAVCAYADHGGELDREARRMLRGFGDFVAANWTRPDASLWEERESPRHHTHSKVLCWTALDGLLRLHRKGLLPKLDAARIAEARGRIGDAVRAGARDLRTGAYTAQLGESGVDAALLLLAWYGFEPPDSGPMRATLAQILEDLGAGDALLYRNRALRAEGDGAFLACSFWAAELLADGAGTLEDAERWFRALVRRAPPTGLYAEEIEPSSGRALGNFPQAFSHVGLISGALAIEERRVREAGRRPAVADAVGAEGRA